MRALPVRYKFVMPGNTDYAVTAESFKAKYTNPENGLRFVRDEVWHLDGVDLCFLSTVDFTNHCLKDGEAFDRFSPENHCGNLVFSRSQRDTSAQGSVVCDDGISYAREHFEIYASKDELPPARLAQLNDTVYDRLKRLAAQCTQPALLFSHAPPFGTCADLVRKGLHVGSADIRRCVEEGHFEMVVSGHIHQSVYTSGHFEDLIGTTRVLTVGNTGIDRLYLGRMAALSYDTERKQAQRIELLCAQDFSITIDRHYERYDPQDK